MSVLIKGMEMPKTCIDCVFGWNGWCHRINSGAFIEFDMRRHDCPLIELLPHGDLIDRDALIKDGWLSLHKEVMRMGGYAIHELPLINPSIPVVLESEET